MAEYLAPGVYVEEIELGTRPIEGVSTSTAGLLGPTERGPVAPQLLAIFSSTAALRRISRHLSSRLCGRRVLPQRWSTVLHRSNCGRGAATVRSGSDLGPVRAKPSARARGQPHLCQSGARQPVASDEQNPRSELFKLTLYYWRTLPTPWGGPQMWVESSSIPWTHATGPMIRGGVSQTSWRSMTISRRIPPRAITTSVESTASRV